MPLEPEPAVENIPVAQLLRQADAPAPEQPVSPEGSDDGVQESVQGVEGQEQGLQEVVAPTLKDRVAELGFKDVSDDGDAQQRLIDAYVQQRETQQQIQQQMELLRAQFMAQQSPQQPTQPQNPEQPQDWWSAPKGNEVYRQQYVAGKSDDGSIQWKPNTPPQVIKEYEDEQAYYRTWADKLIYNPKEALQGFRNEVLSEAKKQFEDFYRQQTQSQQAASFVDQQLKEHEDVFYQRDPVTREVRRDFRGQAMMTDVGIRFESILGELASHGVHNEIEQWNLAKQIYKGRFGDLKPEAVAPVTTAQKMQQAREARASKTTPPIQIAPRNGQDAVNRGAGGRPEMQGFGSRFFAENPGIVIQ